jgi:hypothetical protein
VKILVPRKINDMVGDCMPMPVRMQSRPSKEA